MGLPQGDALSDQGSLSQCVGRGAHSWGWLVGGRGSWRRRVPPHGGSIPDLPHLAPRSTHSSAPWGQLGCSPGTTNPHLMLHRSRKQTCSRRGDGKSPISPWRGGGKSSHQGWRSLSPARAVPSLQRGVTHLSPSHTQGHSTHPPPTLCTPSHSPHLPAHPQRIPSRSPPSPAPTSPRPPRAPHRPRRRTRVRAPTRTPAVL